MISKIIHKNILFLKEYKTDVLNFIDPKVDNGIYKILLEKNL